MPVYNMQEGLKKRWGKGNSKEKKIDSRTYYALHIY